MVERGQQVCQACCQHLGEILGVLEGISVPRRVGFARPRRVRAQRTARLGNLGARTFEGGVLFRNPYWLPGGGVLG